MPSPKQPRREYPKTAFKKLLRFHENGVEINSDKTKATRVWCKTIKPKLTPDYVRKARLFAKAFKREDIENWTSADGKWSLLSWGHVRHLVSIKDGRRRERMARLAIQNNWTMRKLLEAIQLQERRIKASIPGRRPSQPASLEIALLRLQRHAEQSPSLLDVSFRLRPNSKTEQVELAKKLTLNQKKQLVQKVVSALRLYHNVLDRQAKQIQKWLTKIDQF